MSGGSNAQWRRAVERARQQQCAGCGRSGSRTSSPSPPLQWTRGGSARWRAAAARPPPDSALAASRIRLSFSPALIPVYFLLNNNLNVSEGVHCGNRMKYLLTQLGSRHVFPEDAASLLPPDPNLFSSSHASKGQVAARQGTGSFIFSFSSGKYTRTLREGVLLLRSNLTSPNVYSTLGFLFCHR